MSSCLGKVRGSGCISSEVRLGGKPVSNVRVTGGGGNLPFDVGRMGGRARPSETNLVKRRGGVGWWWPRLAVKSGCWVGAGRLVRAHVRLSSADEGWRGEGNVVSVEMGALRCFEQPSGQSERRRLHVE